jgi:transcriptional regulator with XRE-family HTH domain
MPVERPGRRQIVVDAELRGSTDHVQDLAGLSRPTEIASGRGALLRFFRERAGLTQRELGERLGQVTQTYISHVERNRIGIRRARVLLIAEIFGLDETGKKLLLDSERPDRGALLRFFREEAGLTQRELGNRIGVSQTYIGHVESNRFEMQRERLLLVADALGLGEMGRIVLLNSERQKVAAPTPLGIMLKQVREARGMSMVELAGAVGLSGGMIARIEQGYTRTSRENLARMANVLGLAGEEWDRFVGMGFAREPKTELGRKVQEYRVRRGMLRAELSRRMGLEYNRVRAIETETSSASKSALEAIAKALKLSEAEREGIMQFARREIEPSEFGKKIRAYRLRAGLGTDELARLIGIARVSLTRMELYHASTHIGTMSRMAGVLHLNETEREELLSLSGNKTLGPSKELGGELRTFRKRRGMLQKEFAAVLSLTASALSRIENGNRSLAMDKFGVVSETLSLSEEEKQSLLIHATRI